MEIDFEAATDPDSHDWVHYCHVHGRFVGLRLRGNVKDVAFCPACGTAVSRYEVRASAALTRSFVIAAYGDGPLCAHGWPDVPCHVLVANDPALEHDFSVAVPEYAAARIVAEIEPDGVTLSWARPCARCRLSFGRRHSPEIEIELQAARKFMDARTRRAQREVCTLASRLGGLFSAMRVLNRQCEGADYVPAHPGFVYAIGNAEVLKIGWTSRHPRAENGRLAQLQTANHAPLELIGLIAGTQADEHALHLHFAEYRLRGEWFKAMPEIVEYFRQP